MSFVIVSIFFYITAIVATYCFSIVVSRPTESNTTNNGVIEIGHHIAGYSVPKYVGSSTDLDSVDCKRICGGDGASEITFHPVLVEDDVYIDGIKPRRHGVYCVRNGSSVIKCNTATSKLVRGSRNNRWSCLPLWPAIFGGADGGDILVCGGKLNDGERRYELRLPPSTEMRPLTDPYSEEDRFKCTPGEYNDGPRDYMNNEYLSMDTNRFKRVRNNCAKFVSNAVSVVRPLRHLSGYCNCLKTHGKFRHVSKNTQHQVKNKISIAEKDNNERSKRSDTLKVLDNIDIHPDDQSTSVFQVPYACSPCIATGDLVSTDGEINFPVKCTKYNQKYFTVASVSDRMPCGTVRFTSASQPPCQNTRVYIGDQGTSYLLRKALKRIDDKLT